MNYAGTTKAPIQCTSVCTQTDVSWVGAQPVTQKQRPAASVTISRYVKLFLRSSKLLRHNFCARNSKLHKKVKHQDRPISLFVNRSGSFMDQ